MKTMDRRRGDGRIHHQTDILVRASSITFQRGCARDLTEDGARLVVPESVQPGHSIIVYLKLEAQRALSFLATVVWAKPEETGTEVGVRFAEGCQSDRRSLARWVHSRRLLAIA